MQVRSRRSHTGATRLLGPPRHRCCGAAVLQEELGTSSFLPCRAGKGGST